ncbi:MAPEG domain containing protein [Acanthamoeba castellanii str. Neff]|uniref:Microsomal glutathione S-transferase 1 n=1 Tax=Acanthamoeba castellanii (strain ATCC 30010 / Neff) TaxID=1257118 RepID=L8GPP8_ACACF|nr:MAPEG domain containing protein [Acanthamoeba castellanii str. Neff]ELR14907.1 MAPEG domain containing protein [Acanthamoeba castellanii str. Neff]
MAQAAAPVVSPVTATFQTFLSDPVFATYVLCVVILTVKMLVVSFNVTRLRLSLKAFKYEEDYVKAPKEKAKELLTKTANHPRITRAYGLHTNDMENIYVFYTIGLLFALTSPSVFYAKALLWTYTGARVLHTVFYLASVQPWRAVSYLVHVVAQVLMLVHIGSTVLTYL